MHSNSSADRPARGLLEAAFGVLRAEAPAHHDLVRDAVARLRVHLVIGGERFAPHAADGRLAVGDAADPAAVTVTTSLAAALALLDARRTLIEAVDAGELDVRGSADALDAAADAFSLFLHGMVRAPSSARLLDELRARVAGAEPGG